MITATQTRASFRLIQATVVDFDGADVIAGNNCRTKIDLEFLRQRSAEDVTKLLGPKRVDDTGLKHRSIEVADENRGIIDRIFGVGVADATHECRINSIFGQRRPTLRVRQVGVMRSM